MAQARQVWQTSKCGDAGKDRVGLSTTISRECIVPQRLVRSRHGLLIMSCMSCNNGSPAQSEKSSRKHCVCECTDSRRRETSNIYALARPTYVPYQIPNTTYQCHLLQHIPIMSPCRRVNDPKELACFIGSKVQTHRDARSASPTLWLTCRNELAGSGNRSMGWLRSSCRCVVQVGQITLVGSRSGWLAAV